MTPYALLHVILVFAGVVYAIRKKVPIGLALLGGAVGIALLQGMPVGRLLSELSGTATSASTAEFVGVIAFVVALSVVLDKAGQIGRLSDAFRRCFSSPKVSLAALPTLIGLLPMPGGALFSAPMVKAGAEGLGMRAEEKTAVNYWFRHVLVYSWPLYPSTLLAAQLMGVELKWFALAQVPLLLAAFFGGTWFLLRKVGPGPVVERTQRKRAALDIFVILLPILILITVHIATSWKVVWCVAIGFVFASVWHLIARNLRFRDLLRGLFVDKKYLAMLAMGLGAMLFATMMDRSNAIADVTASFVSWGLPVLILVIVLPMAAAFFSGMNVVFVTATFPILLRFELVAQNPLPFCVLAFAAGWCGTMLSPVHSCLTLSSGYFCSDVGSTMKRLLAPAGVTLVMGAILLVAYGRMLG